MQVTVNVWQVLAGVAIGAGVMTGMQPAPAKAAGPAPTWEHKVATATAFRSSEVLLNQMATDGWEAWATDGNTFYFRRPKP